MFGTASSRPLQNSESDKCWESGRTSRRQGREKRTRAEARHGALLAWQAESVKRRKTARKGAKERKIYRIDQLC